MNSVEASFPTRNILVTGGAGFLGSHLVRRLLSESVFGNARIVVLDDLSGGFRDNLPEHERLEFIEGSIGDTKLIDELFEAREFEVVYHLAAYAAEGLSHFIRRFNYSNNVLGSMNLINAAIRCHCKCFVFTSSIAVYGHQRPPMRETDTPIPADPYGIAKYAVELDLRAAHEMFGLPYVIFRPHNVYGEFQNTGDPYRNVVGIFIRASLEGRPMPVFGDGSQTRSFTYAGDISRAICLAPFIRAAQCKTFNIGNDEVTSVIDLAATVAQAFKAPTLVEHLPERKEVYSAFADHAFSHQVFGDLIDNTLLVDGLDKMVAWVRRKGVRSSTIYKDIEILDQLPPSWRKLL